MVDSDPPPVDTRGDEIVEMSRMQYELEVARFETYQDRLGRTQTTATVPLVVLGLVFSLQRSAGGGHGSGMSGLTKLLIAASVISFFSGWVGALTALKSSARAGLSGADLERWIEYWNRPTEVLKKKRAEFLVAAVVEQEKVNESIKTKWLWVSFINIGGIFFTLAALLASIFTSSR